MERGLAELRAPPERLERLKSILHTEARMLQVVEELNEEVAEIARRIREEQAGEGF